MRLVMVILPDKIMGCLPGRVLVGGKLKVTFQERDEMPQGTIKKLTDKGFGFIDTGNGKDLFFHLSNLEDVSYEELEVGQRVSYNEGQGPKGPRAENVKPV